MYSKQGFGLSNIPPIVKNLILINVIVLLADITLQRTMGFRLSTYMGLHFFKSEVFNPLQFVTHMFMHGSFGHLFFNMFALFMFGRVLETVWGPKRFLTYYFVTGLGAALIHTFVLFLQYTSAIKALSPEQIGIVMDNGRELYLTYRNYTNPAMGQLNMILNVPTVGASGAVFGVLLAFGMLFPNTQLMLLIPPIPIKAKYFVIFYGGLELYLAISQPGSNIAHAAHVGGMIFGFFMIRYWKKNTNNFY
jgi:membrane associated rhomboid family serine protease